MTRLRPAVVLAILAAFGGLIALLTAAPPGVTLRSDVRPASVIALPPAGSCFGVRVLPDETNAVRFTAAAGAATPARIELRVPGAASQRSAVGVRRGQRVEYRLPHAIAGDHAGAAVCVPASQTRASVMGESTQPTIDLLGANRANWITAVPLLAERASFGRGTVLGVLALPLALLALLAAWLVAIRLAAGPMLAPGPVTRGTAARVGLVAGLFAAAFAVTTPPIQAPDEMVHLHYAQLLTDQHQLPQTTEVRGDAFSPQLREVIAGAAVGRVAFSPDRRPPWSELEDQGLDRALAALPAGGSKDGFDNASSQPPAYYATIAVAQTLTGGSVLDRLLVSRLVSALLFALGVAGAVVFAREAVPRAGGLVIAGGLLLACLPLVGFIGGSVNPDAALLATSAWTLALIARILRRGVTVRRGLLLGLLVGLGLLSKLTFIPLLPAVALTALIVLVRGVRARRPLPALAAVGASLGVALVVALPYFAWAVLSGRGIAFSTPNPAAFSPVISMRETLTYTFELFFGQVGPLADRIPGSGPLDIWAAGLAGSLGWLDYGFPRHTVLRLAAFWGVLGLGAAVGLVRSARARRALPIDAVVYGVVTIGLMLMIARSGLYSRLTGAIGFEQARYLLPIAAIGVGGVALALRQLPGERLRSWAGSLIVVVALVHGTAAFFLTVGRYFA